MSAGQQHRPHDGQGWLGKASKAQRRTKRKPKRQQPKDGRRFYG